MTALSVFNTLVIFLAANLLLFVGDHVWRQATGRSKLAVIRQYGLELLQQAYPHRSQEETLELLEETWTRPLVYEPFTLFRDGAYRGRFVNVAAQGFRAIKNQGPWPPGPGDYNIFVFGGSTTFGYGVADDETVPSYLQAALPASAGGRRIRVYNFGRASYYSTQERILFEQMLTAGVRPQLAVFIDGLNEFIHPTDAPRFSQGLERLFNDGHWGPHGLGIFGQLPVLQKLEKLGRSIVRRTRTDRQDEGMPAAESANQLEARAAYACRRYLNNIELIEAAAQRFETGVAFVWQPVPAYQLDLAQHPFMKSGLGNHATAAHGYPLMASLVASNAPVANFFWCADVQQNQAEPLYVDAVHYSPVLCKLLATEIAAQIHHHQLIQ